MTREKLFSVTEKDCRFDFYRGSGKGGQKKNKTSSACRCSHQESGAMGSCEDHRSQRKNKETAFKRMCESQEFQLWAKLEVMKISGKMAEIEEDVDRQMTEVIVEVKKDGKWIKEND